MNRRRFLIKSALAVPAVVFPIEGLELPCPEPTYPLLPSQMFLKHDPGLDLSEIAHWDHMSLFHEYVKQLWYDRVNPKDYEVIRYENR